MLILAAMVAGIWTALALAVIRNCLEIKQLRPYDGPIPEDWPRVEVVVPALNEEARVAETIERLLAQTYPNLLITVVDDQSTDRTGAILDELAATKPLRVIHGRPRPAGWVGKTWAIAQGTEGAAAEWLLFLDADMGLDPRTVATAMRQAETAKADLVSILARPEIETFWQGAIAVAIGQILFTMYPLHKANDPDSPVAIAAGGFILARRSVYEKAGGHAAVRSEIVEDIQLGRRVKESGGRLSIHFAPDLAWTHMYGSFRDLWVGLRKNAYAGMEYQMHKYVVGAIGGQVMAWTPWLALVLAAVWHDAALAAAGAWGLLAQVVSVAPIIPYLRISPWFTLAIAPGSLAYTAIATSSVWNHHRGRILWKGVAFASREVQAASRPPRGKAKVAQETDSEAPPPRP